MSLLLDALKKSGQDKNAATGNQGGSLDAKPGLALEELPQKRAQPAPVRSEPTRDAGKNLFAAKKAAPARRKMKLGIVPIALIAGTVIGSSYGFYVWWEITPHSAARPIPRPAPAPVVPAPPSPQVAVSTAPAPPAAVPIATPPAAPVQIERKPVAATRHRTPHKVAQALTIEKQQQVDTITPLLNAAYQAYRNGDFFTAQNNYSEVLQQDENNHDALLGMAAIARQQGQDASAAQYYGKLLALDPRDPSANAGMAALGKGDLAEKESRMKLLLEQQPQSAALHFSLGNLYAAQARWPEAQQAYFDAYSLHPDAAPYAYNLAISLDHLGQGKQAALYYQRALQLDSSGNADFDHTQAQQRLNELNMP